QPLESEIEFFRAIRSVVPVNLNEEPLDGSGRAGKQGRKIQVRLEPKKIASFKLEFQELTIA
ncbi:MAG: hypothetical protein PHQ12_14250, partial [Chthoniobacteraceae bacterium]|nr:hypothetical protein [Chthoniobacteraceae bacterium]